MNPARQGDTREALDGNIRSLMAAAHRHVRPTDAFRQSLRQRLEWEAKGQRTGEADFEHRPCLDDNLSRLLTAATAGATLDAGTRHRLRGALNAHIEPAGRRRHIPRLIPALGAAAVAVVVLAGFFLYPLLWSHTGPHVDMTVTQNEAEVIQTRPVFFTLGTRTVTRLLTEGENFALHSGDTILTGVDSSAVVSVLDSGELTLYPESDLTFSQLRESRANAPPSALARLDGGFVKTEVTGILFALDTPAAFASVEGTAFDVSVVADFHTHISTDEGTVRVDMDGHTVRVSAGEEVDAIKGQPLTVHEQRPPRIVIESPSTPEVSESSITLAGTTDVDAKVNVDGKQVPVTINGRFEAHLELEPGRNAVEVTATSPTGKSVTVDIILVLEQE